MLVRFRNIRSSSDSLSERVASCDDDDAAALERSEGAERPGGRYTGFSGVAGDWTIGVFFLSCTACNCLSTIEDAPIRSSSISAEKKRRLTGGSRI